MALIGCCTNGHMYIYMRAMKAPIFFRRSVARLCHTRGTNAYTKEALMLLLRLRESVSLLGASLGKIKQSRESRVGGQSSSSAITVAEDRVDLYMTGFGCAFFPAICVSSTWT